MGYWALKGCGGLAGSLCVGKGVEVRHTPKPVMRTLTSCSEWCAVLEAVVSGEPEELALLSPMAVIVFGVKCVALWRDVWVVSGTISSLSHKGVSFIKSTLKKTRVGCLAQ